MLHEVVGDSFEVEAVSVYDAAQYGAAFLKLNPNHGVPTASVIVGRDMTLPVSITPLLKSV